MHRAVIPKWRIIVGKTGLRIQLLWQANSAGYNNTRMWPSTVDGRPDHERIAIRIAVPGDAAVLEHNQMQHHPSTMKRPSLKDQLKDQLKESESSVDDQMAQAIVDALSANDKVIEIRPAKRSKMMRLKRFLLFGAGVIALAYWAKSSQKPNDAIKGVKKKTANRIHQAAESIEAGSKAASERIEEGSERASEAVQEAGEKASGKAEETGKKASEQAEETGEKASKKAKEAGEKAAKKTEEAGEKTAEQAEEAGEKASEQTEETGEKMAEKMVEGDEKESDETDSDSGSSDT